MLNLISHDDVENETKLFTDHLIGNNLDFFVAKAKEKNVFINKKNDCAVVSVTKPSVNEWAKFSPSKLWIQCGPLIEQERLSVEFHGEIEDIPCWAAYAGFEPPAQNETTCYGPSPLIAACRCIVKLVFGHTIDLKQYPILIEQND